MMGTQVPHVSFFSVHDRPARHDGAQAVEVTVGVTVCLNSTALLCQSFGRTEFMKNKKMPKKKEKKANELFLSILPLKGF